MIYLVTVKQLDTYDIEVEADNEEDAKNKAYKIMETPEDALDYISDSDSTTEAEKL